jgi:hypothetical protein
LEVELVKKSPQIVFEQGDPRAALYNRLVWQDTGEPMETCMGFHNKRHSRVLDAFPEGWPKLCKPINNELNCVVARFGINFKPIRWNAGQKLQ